MLIHKKKKKKKNRNTHWTFLCIGSLRVRLLLKGEGLVGGRTTRMAVSLLEVLVTVIFAEAALSDLGEQLSALDEIHDEVDPVASAWLHLTTGWKTGSNR